MGDRANIIVDKEICLYAHWAGADLAVVLQDALRRGKNRWSDSSYLTRIIFSEMIKDDVLEETGYGISTTIPDNEYPLIWVNTDNKTVRIGLMEYTFDEYIKEDAKELEDLMYTKTSDRFNYDMDPKVQYGIPVKIES